MREGKSMQKAVVLVGAFQDCLYKLCVVMQLHVTSLVRQLPNAVSHPSSLSGSALTTPRLADIYRRKFNFFRRIDFD